MTQRTLIILHPGFEEMEAVAPIDLLSRAGIELIQATTAKNIETTGRSGITMSADTHLPYVAEQDFDAIILPGGPGISKLRNDPTICELLKRHYTNGQLVACICAAPLLLLDAGILSELSEYTAHPTTQNELPQSTGKPLATSTNVITSLGAGTANEFALAIVAHLAGSEKAKEIAQSIGCPHLV